MTAASGFAAFLEAKFALDERSLDPAVRAAFLDFVRARPGAHCLDVGAGTGATLRRLLQHAPGPLALTALDRDAELLARARRTALALLHDRGHGVSAEADRITAADGTTITLVHDELDRHRPRRAYDAVIAHAVLDIVALDATLERFAAWLRPGGVLYASLNYDGETRLRPAHGAGDLESDLLAWYDRTMEARRVDGLATGGAQCGRRLLARLPDHGFDLVVQGRSDWRIRAVEGRYPDRDAHCLRTILDLIVKEARTAGRFDRDTLEGWREHRLQLLGEARLELDVRHVDVLARLRG